MHVFVYILYAGSGEGGSDGEAVVDDDDEEGSALVTEVTCVPSVGCCLCCPIVGWESPLCLYDNRP